MTAARITCSGLTELFLRYTEHKEPPLALSLLTNLQVLHLSKNREMQPMQPLHDDLSVLDAFHGLKALRLEDRDFGEDCMPILDAMKEQLPHLDAQVFAELE